MSWFCDLFCTNLSKSNPIQQEDPKHLKYAYGEMGISEIAGKGYNQRIIDYHLTTGIGASDDSIAWCSSFVNWCFKKAGIQGTNSASARSWLKFGEWEGHFVPERGDVCILWRESRTSWKGHVGFYIKSDKKFVYLLGGNQGDRVCIEKYPKDRVLGFRRSPR